MKKIFQEEAKVQKLLEMVFYGLNRFFVFLTPTNVYQCFLVESLQPRCIPLKQIYTGPTQQAR